MSESLFDHTDKTPVPGNPDADIEATKKADDPATLLLWESATREVQANIETNNAPPRRRFGSGGLKGFIDWPDEQ